MPRNTNSNNNNLKTYINALEDFLQNKKYGAITFFVQNGKVTGVDIIEKQRNISDTQSNTN